jgi:hypothetical protein
MGVICTNLANELEHHRFIRDISIFGHFSMDKNGVCMDHDFSNQVIEAFDHGTVASHDRVGGVDNRTWSKLTENISHTSYYMLLLLAFTSHIIWNSSWSAFLLVPK